MFRFLPDAQFLESPDCVLSFPPVEGSQHAQPSACAAITSTHHGPSANYSRHLCCSLGTFSRRLHATRSCSNIPLRRLSLTCIDCLVPFPPRGNGLCANNHAAR